MNVTTRRRRLLRKTAIATSLAALAAPSHAQLVLEEIIVTAQKRVESVQDISATVNVVTGDSIDRFAAFSFSEIEQQTAGLTLASPNSRNSTIALRGVSVDPESGTQAAVDVYWNDAIVRPDIAFTQLYDLQRVEILRGPQGTLQGRTSPAGAINIISNRAYSTGEGSGYVQLSGTDNEGMNAQVAYGAPIIEGTLGARVAAVYDTEAGRDITNITTGFDDQEIEASSARLSTVWNATDDFTAELIWQYLDQEQDDPKAMTGVDSLGERPTLQPGDGKALGPSDDGTDLEFNVVNLIMDWSVMDHEVTGIVAYQDSDKESQTENDRANSIALSGTGSTGPSFQTSDTEVESWSYELRVASTGNDFWDYMVGVFYQDLNTDTEFNANTVRLDVSGIGFGTAGTLPVYSNNAAIFTFNTFYLTDDLQLEVGLRYTEFDGFRRADVFYDGLNFIPPSLAPIIDVVEAGFEAAFPIIAVNDNNSNEDAVTGSIKLRWDWTDDVSIYGSYNRGYRPGGISIVPTPNIELLPNGEDDLFYDEEESDAFEIGIKSRPLGGRATLNAALFFQQFDGYQGFVRGVSVLDEDGIPQDLPGGIVFNGDANIWGVEFDGQVLLTETWSAGGALAYTDAEWDGATQPCNDRDPGEILGNCDIEGEPLGGAPEWSMSLNSEYYYPLDSTELYVRGLFKYTDERQNQDASAGLFDVAEEFEDYYTLDLFAGWRSSDLQWDLTVWAKNVTDEDEVIYQQGPDTYDIQVSDGSYTQTNILQERVIGATARYNF